MTRSRLLVIAPKLAVLGLTVLLAACSMAESLYLSPVGSQSCVSQSGSYYLSKSYLTVRVDLKNDDAAANLPPVYELNSVAVSAQPDRTQLYCLDYRASPTANDTLIIQKSPENLLQKITSNAEDRSAEIAGNFIQAIFVGISQNPDFDRTLTTRLRLVQRKPRISEGHVRLTFDPFNTPQLDLANETLRRTGFCLLLEKGDDEDRTRQRDIDRYCDRPLGRDKREWKLEESTEDFSAFVPPEINGPVGDGSGRQRARHAAVDHARHREHGEPIITQGILYRPRVGHTVALYVKANLGHPGGWSLRSRATLMMENVSPTIALGIDRAFFAKRKTTIEFDGGVLKDIEIEKGSELLGFSTIPLTIAQSIAALPANIIQVRIKDTNNRAELIAAQQALLEQKLQIANLRGVPRTGSLTPPPPAGFSDPDGTTPRLGQGQQQQQEQQAGVTVPPPDSIGGTQQQIRVQPRAGTIEACFATCGRAGDPNVAVCRRYCDCVKRCESSGSRSACMTFCDPKPN